VSYTSKSILTLVILEMGSHELICLGWP
jgi:hypothetical protein